MVRNRKKKPDFVRGAESVFGQVPWSWHPSTVDPAWSLTFADPHAQEVDNSYVVWGDLCRDSFIIADDFWRVLTKEGAVPGPENSEHFDPLRESSTCELVEQILHEKIKRLASKAVSGLERDSAALARDLYHVAVTLWDRKTKRLRQALADVAEHEATSYEKERP